MSPETHVRVDFMTQRRPDGYYVGMKVADSDEIKELGPFPTQEVANQVIATYCEWAIKRGAIEVPGGLPN